LFRLSYLYDMNLQESIRRILREMKQLRDMLQPATPEGKLHHYSTYKNRESIQKNGLLPKVGRQTANYMSHNFPDVEPVPMVFAQDPSHGNFFGVYGSDLWEIDLNQINNNWYHDPIHKDDENKWGFFVTLDPIPPSAIRLISSDEQRDDDMEVYRQTGEYPKRETEEPQQQEEPNKWDDLLNQLGDDDFTFNMDDLKLQESIRRILREEIDEYARTLKNARRQGAGLRFPKSVVKANPSRFRKYSREEQTESEITERCWKGYTQKGMKTMFGKRYPNCVKIKKK